MRVIIDDSYKEILDRWGDAMHHGSYSATIEFMLKLVDGDDEEWLRKCREKARQSPG